MLPAPQCLGCLKATFKTAHALAIHHGRRAACAAAHQLKLRGGSPPAKELLECDSEDDQGPSAWLALTEAEDADGGGWPGGASAEEAGSAAPLARRRRGLDQVAANPRAALEALLAANLSGGCQAPAACCGECRHNLDHPPTRPTRSRARWRTTPAPQQPLSGFCVLCRADNQLNQALGYVAQLGGSWQPSSLGGQQMRKRVLVAAAGEDDTLLSRWDQVEAAGGSFMMRNEPPLALVQELLRRTTPEGDGAVLRPHRLVVLDGAGNEVDQLYGPDFFTGQRHAEVHAAVAAQHGRELATILLSIWSDSVALDRAGGRASFRVITLGLANHPLLLQQSDAGTLRLALVPRLRRGKGEPKKVYKERAEAHEAAAMEHVMQVLKVISYDIHTLLDHRGTWPLPCPPSFVQPC